MKLLILCVCLLGSALASAPQTKALQPLSERFITANVNDYVDTILPSIIEFLIDSGLDPLDLPDIYESFTAKPILITYTGRLELTRGVFDNLRSLRRSGDVQVQYASKILKVSANFALDQISFYYDFLAKIWNIGPTGGVTGSVRTASIFCEALIDFNNMEIHLQDFYFYDVGSLSLRFSGNVLVDWLANALSSVITTLFKSVIINAVENAMRNALQGFINSINDNISNSKSYLDKLMIIHKQVMPISPRYLN